MNESYSSSQSNSLKRQMKTLQSISKNESDSSVVKEFESKVKENLNLKEDVINLQSQLKIAQETSKLQEAEYAFRISEYEAEIRNLKQIEDELRKALGRLNQEKEENKQQMEIKIQQQIEEHEREKNDYYEAANAQVSKLRSTITELQGQNEILNDDIHKCKQEILDLQNQLENQKHFYENKLKIVVENMNKSKSAISEVTSSLRSNQVKYEKQIAELEADLLENKSIVSELKCENQILKDKEQTFSQQIQNLLAEHNALNEKIADENTKSGKLRTYVQQLKNRVDIAESEKRSLQRQLIHAEDNVQAKKSVTYCSPLQRARIDIYKIIEDYYNKMIKATNELFPDVHNQEIKFRSVILYIIFGYRWLKNTRNEENICDNKGGLIMFSPVNDDTPLYLITRARNDLSTANCITNDIRVKSDVAEHQLSSLITQNKRSKQIQEALTLQLISAKKCNNTLHKQLNSFIAFHDQAMEYKSNS